MIPKLLLQRRDELGEGMMWLEATRRIAWVDILGKRLMISDDDGKNLVQMDQETEIGAVLPSIGEELILVLRNEVVAFNVGTGERRLVWSAAELEPASNRFNDATVDRNGNLWIGSMDFDADAPNGNLWRVAPDGTAKLKTSGYNCLNGPAFSPDGGTLYVGDTMAGRVLAFDLDISTGDLSNERILIDLNPFEGLPDGMAVDSEGNIWLCQVTAGRIGCYSPLGVKKRAVALPVPMVTSCCFGGRDLRTLYVTSARIILDEPDLAAYPRSGSLYTIATGVQGLPPNRFGAVPGK